MHPESVAELLLWTPPPSRPVIADGVLEEQSRLILFGMWDSLKSMVAMHTGFCIATGKPWLGYKTTTNPTLIVQLELPKVQNWKRIVKYCTGNHVAPKNLYFIHDFQLKLDKDYSMKSLEQAILSTGARVLIVDPIYKVLSGDISSSTDVLRFLDNMDGLIIKYGLTIILVGHTKKFTPDQVWNWGQELMGSSYFQNWTDTAVYLERKLGVEEERKEVVLQFVKTRLAEETIKPINLVVDTYDLTFGLTG